MRVVQRICFLFLLAGGLAACDRTPTDPALEADLEASLASGASTSVYAASATSLSTLFRSAVVRIERTQGAAVQQRLLADWRRLNDEARAALQTGERETAQLKIAGVRAAEVRMVLFGHGNRVVNRVLQDVGVELARTQLALTDAANRGADVRRGRTLAAQTSDLLQQANAALERGNLAAALDAATRASDVLDGAAHFLISLQRIPALETLYAEAVTAVEREYGRSAADLMQGVVSGLDAEARAALRHGDRVVAGRRLESARLEQIRIVVRLRGSGVVRTLIAQVEGSLAETRAQLERVSEPRLLERAQPMLREAASLNARATAALQRSDPVTALDLASHAAGLMNAVQHLIPR